MALLKELGLLYKDSQSRRCIYAISITFIGILLMFYWVYQTNSLSLRALTFLTLFDFANLVTALLFRWSERQQPSLTFTYGYSRVEVVAVFSATLLTQFISFFIIKEAVHHLIEGLVLRPDSMLIATVFGLILHFTATLLVKNPAYEHLARSSSSNWVQDTVNDLGSSLFGYVPLLAGVFLPGKPLNPLALVTCLSSLGVAAAYYLVTAYEWPGADPAIAMLISFITIATLLPMTVYTGKVLLQTTPGHMISSLDKCLREAATLDGVLEFRNEHFWTLTWGVVAGTLDVRVRRDANEQTVLAEVTHRLSQHVTLLSVQVIKEETPALFTSLSHAPSHKQPAKPTAYKPAASAYNYKPVSNFGGQGFRNEKTL